MNEFSGDRRVSADRPRHDLPPTADRMASATLRTLADAERGGLSGADLDALRDLTRGDVKAVDEPRAGDRLLATAAHELRHPLQLMQWTLARQVPDANHPLRVALEPHINRMARLITDLLDLAGVTGEEPPLRRERVDAFRLLSGLRDDYRPAAAAKGVRMALDLPRSVLWLDADPDRLTQVFCILIDNALRHTPAGGAVAVEALANGDHAEIHVRDTGAGFPAHGSSASTQADRTPSKDRRLGVGLSIATRIVERHGGALAIRSDGSTRGTHVVVTLPRLGTESTSPGGPAPADRRPAPVSPVREIESAFREMPGLILTVAQAARLFSRDEASVGQALEALVAQGALRRLPNGYVRVG